MGAGEERVGRDGSGGGERNRGRMEETLLLSAATALQIWYHFLHLPLLCFLTSPLHLSFNGRKEQIAAVAGPHIFPGIRYYVARRATWSAERPGWT